MDAILFFGKVRTLFNHMNNPWFKGDSQEENTYYKRIASLYFKVSDYNYNHTPEDEKELEELESHKPNIPCPYSFSYPNYK